MNPHAPVMIMAGGTGGHIFPGIAVARELALRGVPVIWLGSVGGLEERLVPQAGFALTTLRVTGLRGKGWRALLGAPLRIVRAVLQALSILRRERPSAVLSMGGFAAGPGGIAAWLARRPLIVHEQNRVPGYTNRVLSLFAKKILSGFSDAFAPARHAQWVGNPVRSEIVALARPAERFADRRGTPRLLVLGGSQGAHALNVRVPQALQQMPIEQRPEVRHQCGARHADRARDAYEMVKVSATVETFIEDMAAAYAWADLVVCRSGALTVAELSAAGIGAVLIPFPHAVDDHQTRNGQTLVEVGAAVLLAESEASAEKIASVLTELLGDRTRLLNMAQAARALAQPDSASRIASCCLEVA
jgi:UDP-N-acetylglucosamine--N-acetylmuramyl-(pentapeptide) pyrophosphoryl-undecaprenol N-acetylglucosamine transferase